MFLCSVYVRGFCFSHFHYRIIYMQLQRYFYSLNDVLSTSDLLYDHLGIKEITMLRVLVILIANRIVNTVLRESLFSTTATRILISNRCRSSFHSYSLCCCGCCITIIFDIDVFSFYMVWLITLTQI